MRERIYNGIERERCTSCGARHFEKYGDGLKCRICGARHKEQRIKEEEILSELFVIEGPAKVGNKYGLCNYTIPQGKFAIAFIGKLSNGIISPIVRFPNIFFDTKEKAESLCKCLTEETKKAPMYEDYPVLDRK